MESNHEENKLLNNVNHEANGTKRKSLINDVKEKAYRRSQDLELISQKYEVEKMIRRPSTIPKSPTVTSADFDEYADMYKNMPLTDETTCGIWFIKGGLLQKAANKKMYVLLYGLLGCFYAATYAYFNGTITTLEKRFKIPSKVTGVISIGNDISQILVSLVVSYYAGKGHRPRWIALGAFTIVVFCLLTALPHFIYGPGEDSLQLTEEYGQGYDANTTIIILEKQRRKLLCQSDSEPCFQETGSFYPQIILFVAQFISGIGGSLYYSLGTAYMDDNIQKAKTPVLISLSYFLRMLGPALGYALASFCLKVYVSPSLTPTIGMNDPRWLGAWWMGWLMLASVLTIFSVLLALFPKTLPRAAVRRAIAQEKRKGQPEEKEEPPSIADMMKTIKRLLKNKTYVCNNISSIFYCLGYMPYWIFMPKYIETQYKQSASVSSFVTGTVGLVFSAIGVLVSGMVITKYKPSARILAAWNVIVSAISVIGIITYMSLGCDVVQRQQTTTLTSDGMNLIQECNMACNCEYKPYSPVCSEENETFISPCHAGCQNVEEVNGTKIFKDCSCINPVQSHFLHSNETKGFARSGTCPIDCTTPFYTFLAVVCLLKFVGASGRSSNFLVGVRCVDEKDKTAAMGFSVTILSLFAFVPSPIVFGYILDTTCLVWGKTCTGTGNCWLYDGLQLRYVMNLTAAFLVSIGTLFDAGVWYYVKNLKIFDDDVKVKAVGVGDLGD